MINIGDRIKFRAVTRWSAAAVWRKVVAVDPVQVRYGGYADFLVEPHEILEVERAEPAKAAAQSGETAT